MVCAHACVRCELWSQAVRDPATGTDASDHASLAVTTVVNVMLMVGGEWGC